MLYLRGSFTLPTSEKVDPRHECDWFDRRGRCVTCGAPRQSRQAPEITNAKHDLAPQSVQAAGMHPVLRMLKAGGWCIDRAVDRDEFECYRVIHSVVRNGVPVTARFTIPGDLVRSRDASNCADHVYRELDRLGLLL